MLKNKVIEQLKTVYDPEMPVDIYELGLIYDISFEDNFVDEGNMYDKYEDKNYLVDKYEIPNYIDAFDIEKYKINLKRTMMTGKH